MIIQNFKKFLLEGKYPEPKKKIYDVVTKIPNEKKNIQTDDKLLYRGIKEELLNFVHKNFLRLLRNLIEDYDIPKEVKQQWEKELMVPITDISKKQNENYASQIASLYSIFKKYIEIKKVVRKKIEKEEAQKFPLGTIKNLISQGKKLSEIAEYFGVPESTMSYKIADIHQTTYSKLKKDMGK